MELENNYTPSKYAPALDIETVFYENPASVDLHGVSKVWLGRAIPLGDDSLILVPGIAPNELADEG